MTVLSSALEEVCDCGRPLSDHLSPDAECRYFRSTNSQRRLIANAREAVIAAAKAHALKWEGTYIFDAQKESSCELTNGDLAHLFLWHPPPLCGSGWPITPLRIADMELINLRTIYQWGLNLAPLSRLTEVRVRWRLKGILRESSPWLDGILNSPALRVCRNDGTALMDRMTELHSEIPIGDEEEDPDMSPYWNGQYEVSRLAERFTSVLAAELESLESFFVSQKAAYSTSMLINQAESVLPQSALNRLPPNSIQDIQESGKCLAFNTPTAAGFHILRATEAVMHEYYLVACTPPNSRRLANWGRYVAALRRNTDPSVLKVASLLDQIRDLDRNPIMHPRAFLDADEALSIFELAKSAIILMARALHARVRGRAVTRRRRTRAKENKSDE